MQTESVNTQSKKEKIENRLAVLPGKPGVYLMQDVQGRILYVGKAKNLANRVRSYFRGQPANPKVAALVRRIENLDYIVTDSEAEALILESNLIKEHKPRYNVDLKDDKRYPYLKVTVNEVFPRAFVTRRFQGDGARYFGPFTNAGALRTTLEVLRKVFPLRTCKHDLPEKKGLRECLNYHLGNCSGPCYGHISREDYLEMVREVLQFLDGKTEGIEQRVEAQMRQASLELNFELAARYRDQLAAVRKVSERQKMYAIEGGDADILAAAVDGYDACVVLLKVRAGKLLGSEHRMLRNSLGEPSSAVLNAFLGRNYLGNRDYPGTVYLGQEIEDREIYESLLSLRSGRRVRLLVPERGEKARLARLAEKNSHLLLEEVVLHRQQARQRVPEALLGLQKTLKLPHLPRQIVCFDVSTIQGAYAVAAMSCFRNGNPYKNGYRRFRISRTAGQDDFAMIREAVRRFFLRVAAGETGVPHLVLIDGGRGQLSAASEAIRQSGLELPPLAALAKKEEELYLPGEPEPFVLSRRSEALRLLQRIRDEAHRFAVGYHRTVRKKQTLRSALEDVPGVGPALARALIEQFGSPAAAARAGEERLAAVKGISPVLARKIIGHLREGQGNA